MKKMPEEENRYAEVVNEQYNDEDTSHLPLFDEGYWSHDGNEEWGAE